MALNEAKHRLFCSDAFSGAPPLVLNTENAKSHSEFRLSAIAIMSFTPRRTKDHNVEPTSSPTLTLVTGRTTALRK